LGSAEEEPATPNMTNEQAHHRSVVVSSAHGRWAVFTWTAGRPSTGEGARGRFPRHHTRGQGSP
jgi:hypothetical protein